MVIWTHRPLSQGGHFSQEQVSGVPKGDEAPRTALTLTLTPPSSGCPTGPSVTPPHRHSLPLTHFCGGHCHIALQGS